MATVSNCVQTAIQTCVSVPTAKLHEIDIEYFGNGASSHIVIVWAIVIGGLLLFALGCLFAYYKAP